MGSSCSSTRDPDPAVAAKTPMDLSKKPDQTPQREQPPAPVVDIRAEATPVPAPPPEPVPKARAPRNPKHVFKIKFKNPKPLGMAITSESNGLCAYVTKTDPKQNKTIKKKKLPLKSKLLKVNGVNVENEKINQITELIRAEMNSSTPLVLTFCHPDGLEPDEYPDPSPVAEFSERQSASKST